MSDLQARLQDFVDRPTSEPQPAPDPVNQPMIRHWVEAMGDENPIYVDEAAALATGRPGVVAPPAMLQAWSMVGYRATVSGQRGELIPGDLLELLNEAGFTSVVATDSEQEYFRELVLGDELTTTAVIESVSDEKQTALGAGHFVTALLTFRDAAGEVVATMRFRLLKFRPPERTPSRPPPPRPAINRDNAFWFAAARQHRLVIQRCSSCGRLRHPPGPCCPACQSFEWDFLEASGRGRVHSFVVNHHPQVSAFEYPLPVLLVELDEGVRLVAGVEGIEPAQIDVDMPVEVAWLDIDAELSLPVFRAAR